MYRSDPAALRAAEILHSVVDGTAATTGEEFFRALTRCLGEACGLRYCFATACLDVPPSRVRTLAFWAGGEFRDNIEYRLRGTPCAAVLGGESQRVARQVREIYPEDPDLVAMEASSYVGVPMFGASGEIIGHLAAVHVEPFDPDDPYLAIFETFAARAGAELERQRTLDRLRASEEKFRALFQSSNDGIFLHDLGGRILDVNPRVVELLGYSREELLGLRVTDLHPESARGKSRVASEALRSDRHIDFEIMMRKRSGEAFPAEISASRLSIAGREVIHALVRDITDRMRTERSLRDSEERLRQVIDLVPHFIFAKDQDGRFILANQAVADLHGTSVRKLIGMSDTDLGIDNETVRRYRADDMEVMRTGYPKIIPEETFTDAQGRLRYVQTTKIPFTFAATDLPSVLCVSIDITESKVAEEQRQSLEAQIQHTQKLESLGVLAGGIAHDFNNLLGGILGNAGLALRSLAEGSIARARIRDVETAAKRAAELSHQMLAYSGKGRFVIQTVDLGRVIREMVPLLEVAISKKARLDLRLAEPSPKIDGDATQIHQVVMNLVTNASEAFAGGEGTITLRTGDMAVTADDLAGCYLQEELTAGRFAFLEVADTGCGMDEETRKKIFDPFFTTKTTGRGLGMAAVLGIVRGHRGTVRVSTASGEGTTFRVLLPLSAGKSDAADAERGAESVECSATEGWQGQGTILVVDDEVMIRDIAQLCLEQAGFEVLLAEDGVRALEVFRDRGEQISAILLDMSMPRLDGLETLAELRKLRPEVRVVLTSGYSDQETGNEAVDGESVSFLTKPYTPDELVEKVRQILLA